MRQWKDLESVLQLSVYCLEGCILLFINLQIHPIEPLNVCAWRSELRQEQKQSLERKRAGVRNGPLIKTGRRRRRASNESDELWRKMTNEWKKTSLKGKEQKRNEQWQNDAHTCMRLFDCAAPPLIRVRSHQYHPTHSLMIAHISLRKWWKKITVIWQINDAVISGISMCLLCVGYSDLLDDRSSASRGHSYFASHALPSDQSSRLQCDR